MRRLELVNTKNTLKDLFLSHDEERRRQGDILGIFLTLNAVIFIIIMTPILSGDGVRAFNRFYLVFDIILIIFILLYFIEDKMSNDKITLEFPDFKGFFYTFIFVFVVFLIYVGINRIVEPFMYGSSRSIDFESRMSIFSSTDIFRLIRVVPSEEVVFRGFGMLIVCYILMNTFNRDKKSENYERNEQIIWYIAIFTTGILFGLAHLPKFLQNGSFPYFTFYIAGQPVLIHIFFPIFLLSIFGVILGLTQYKFGLFGAILLHLANNYYADAIIYNLIIFFGGFS